MLTTAGLQPSEKKRRVELILKEAEAAARAEESDAASKVPHALAHAHAHAHAHASPASSPLPPTSSPLFLSKTRARVPVSLDPVPLLTY